MQDYKSLRVAVDLCHIHRQTNTQTDSLYY